MEVLDLNAYYDKENSIRLQANIMNSGNVDGENVKLIIESFDDKEYMRNFMKLVETKPPVEIKTVDISKLNTSDIYTVDELIEVNPSYINEDGNVPLRVKVVETKNDDMVVAFKENLSVNESFSEIVTEIYEIVINERIDIRMKTGESININARISPYAANNAYTLRYLSLTPEIAEIDYFSGEVYAKQSGDAEILVEAVNAGNSLFLNGDGILYDARGNIAKFDEDSTVITNEKEEVVKASKSIFVNVSEKGANVIDEDSRNRNDTGSTTNITKSKGSVVIQIGNSTLDKESVIMALIELEKESQDEKKLQIMSNSTVIIEREAAELINRSNLNTEISFYGGSLIINQDALSKIISSSQGNIEISFIKTETAEGRPVVDINITSDNKAINYSEAKLFDDAFDISTYAKDAVNVLSRAAIISGKGNNKLEPKQNATRAESTKMLTVLLQQILN